jgi:hypothetical protein
MAGLNGNGFPRSHVAASKTENSTRRIADSIGKPNDKSNIKQSSIEKAYRPGDRNISSVIKNMG